MIKIKTLRTKNVEIIQRECCLRLKDGSIVLIATKIREFIPIPQGEKGRENHDETISKK